MNTVVESTTNSLKTVIETAAPASGITVSTASFMGVALSEWVFIGTAILLVLNLIIALPKAWNVITGK